ncbi:MAG: hypothetical protein DWQ08_09355 [Proteobacteria bacterium]|nr:MAG: hypothetical protein DWQ08_09355 [Pseudomonadota bacterium]
MTEIRESASRDELPVRIRLEIDREKLYALLRDRQLCAADFRCLDCDTRDCVWRLALNACIEMRCGRF